MKKTLFNLFTFVLCFFFIQVNAQDNSNASSYYGQEFEAGDVYVPSRAFLTTNEDGSDEMVQVMGYISEVCQKEGCWIKINDAPTSNENLMVKTQHEFVLPKDIAGKKVLVLGTISEKEISVKEQKHLLEDAGASEAEINAIIQPKKGYQMIAKGVQILD